MSARLPFRISTLLFAALVWAAAPNLVFAGPGAGSGHGGGGGGSHGGGGGSHGGGGHASAATGHVSSPSHGGSGYSANRPSVGYGGHVQLNSSTSAGAGPGRDNLSSFASSSETAAQHGAEAAELSRLAAHGWNFTPSSGVTRAVAAPTTRIPAIRPFPGRRFPYATGTIIPGAGFGFGFGGGYPCPLRPGFTGCGFGYGYGYGYGNLFGLGYGLGYGGYGLFDLPADGNGYYPPDNGTYMDQEGYIAEPGGTVPPDVNAVPPNPDELGTEETPQVPAQIILKGGSAYAVKSYWVSNGELYYQPVTGGLNHVPVDQLDLAATVAANSRNGVPFTLSERPPHE